MDNNFELLPVNKPKEPKPIGRINLEKKPFSFDVKGIAEQFYPEGKYLKTADGDEYILDENGKTILLFENSQKDGFGSVYTPLTQSELKAKLGRIPDKDRQRVFNLYGISNDLSEHRQTIEPIQVTDHVSQKPQRKLEPIAESPARLEDLPEDYFLNLSQEELLQRKQTQWEEVKDLDDNDPRKIVYFRRFTREFRSSTPFDPELTSQSGDNFKYYVPDNSKLDSLPSIEPFKVAVQIPKGRKVGFVVGYYHLEKPWGRIFVDLFKQQIVYNPNQVEFIFIDNKEVPTGERSVASEKEIQRAVQEKRITHLIDVHEQLAMLNHYMDSGFKPEWRKGREINPQGKEHTLDPFVPLWMIEQYCQGNTYPQLQHAVNDQLQKVAGLINEIK